MLGLLATVGGPHELHDLLCIILLRLTDMSYMYLTFTPQSLHLLTIKQDEPTKRTISLMSLFMNVINVGYTTI